MIICTVKNRRNLTDGYVQFTWALPVEDKLSKKKVNSIDEYWHANLNPFPGVNE